MKVEYTEKLVIDTFSKKPNVQEIYALTLPHTFFKEYWLIVDDIYSTEASQCYEEYFDLLDQIDSYFELRLLTPRELQSAMYLQPKKIYEVKEKE